MKQAKEMHRCADCRETVPLRREQVPFGLAGKWAVTVEALVYDCECGRGVIYEGTEQLEKAIANYVVAKQSRLAPEEIRFLRTHLGVEAQELAELLGVSASQVSRWENGASPMSQAADRLLRMMVVQKDGVSYDVLQLGKIGERVTGPRRPMFAFRQSDGTWTVSDSWRKHDRVLRAG